MKKIFEQIKANLTEWLLYYMRCMEEADRQEMRSFYHGDVEAYQEALQLVTRVEVNAEKEAE